MKKKLMAVLLAMGLLCGCGKPVQTEYTMAFNEGLEQNVVDDAYRTFYEVFVYSFYDSDGDGIGDLNGVTEKLDYLNDGDDQTDSDLGVNGIWLMPIMPSNSYHKYDVKDYYDIDPQYGNLDDFKAFMSACEDRDIHVILDLVMNHTSSDHPWFQEACHYLEALPDGAEPDLSECPYVDYYHFTKEKQNKYTQVGDTDWYYESQFVAKMPDLNLSNPVVIDEFCKIADYWMELGVSGFRLDAVGEYESGNVSKSVEELQAFVEKVKEKHDDCYLVGEVWNDMDTYTTFYQSGIDSLFDFDFADSTGIIASTIKHAKNYDATSFGKAQVNVQTKIRENGGMIDAPFYTNHDMARSAGYYPGEIGEAQTKIAQAMNLLMSGNAFLYYGEELGMKGSGRDENKRVPMYWDEKGQPGICAGPPDMESVKMKYGSLKEQQEDEASIYQYVKQVIALRNAYPAIARGTVALDEALSNDSICAIYKEYEDQKLMILYNISDTEQSVDLSAISLAENTTPEIGGVLLATPDDKDPSTTIHYEKQILTMPAYSVVIVH